MTDLAPREIQLTIAIPPTDVLSELVDLIGIAFFSDPYPEAVTIDMTGKPWLLGSLGLLFRTRTNITHTGEEVLRIQREDFLQCEPAWLCAPHMDASNQYVGNGNVRNPVRPARPKGAVYARHIPHLSSQFVLRGLDPLRDQENLHEWMNSDRVNAFWGLKGPREAHRKLLDALLADPHAQPLIGELNGIPFGYFDVYWAREDKVGKYHEIGDFDRGLHMIVGDERFRGPHYVEAWLPSLTHYAFLSERRTRWLVCEPRVDNVRMIDYLKRVGFSTVKEVDFPNKRAMLLRMSRETFLQRWLHLDTPDNV